MPNRTQGRRGRKLAKHDRALDWQMPTDDIPAANLVNLNY
jgi:hypothetical protein